MTTFLVIFKQNIQKECDGIPELLDFASKQRAAPPNYCSWKRDFRGMGGLKTGY